MVVNCLKVFSIQMSLLVVYPVYNYFFQRLKGTEQALFSLVLHVIKIGAKNAIGQYFTHMEDMRPEVVIFNVEVFSALFTSFCMQNATSLLTTLILVISDFIHACLSLRDTNRMLRELCEAQRQMSLNGIDRAPGIIMSRVPTLGKIDRGRVTVQNEHAVDTGKQRATTAKPTEREYGTSVLASAVQLLERSGAFTASRPGPERNNVLVAGPV